LHYAEPFKDEAQTALLVCKDPVRTAQ